jgi:hypothetical protein
MSRNNLANNINKIILKLEKNIEYYQRKANRKTFDRDGLTYRNTPEWQEYWLELSNYISLQVEDYYKVLRIVNRQGLGDIPYPQAPEEKILLLEK